MYTLRVVASERRLSQITLPVSGRGEQIDGATLPCNTALGDDDTLSDDSEVELLGADLDDDSQVIEFSAGNPRVEHITGVVHLYRPTPGRLPQTTQPLSSASTNTTSTKISISNTLPSTRPGHRPPNATLLPSSPPAKGAISWASLFAPAPQASTAPPPAAHPLPSSGQHCDELCCLALPSDMTIADFCTFLGAHLLRVRRMRVLRRQVGSISTLSSTTTTLPSTATNNGTSTALPSSGGLLTAAAGAVAPRVDSGGGGAVTGAAVSNSEHTRLLGHADMQSASSKRPGTAVPGCSRLCTGSGMDAGGVAAGDASTRGSVAGPSEQSGVAAAHSPRAAVAPPDGRDPSAAWEAAAAAGAASLMSVSSRMARRPQPPLTLPCRPPSQRVVCMVVMRMESPEAADELYTDLNGRPFSSLEPDIVCRLVHVRYVEVTSGGGRHASGSATGMNSGGGGIPTADSEAADATPCHAAVPSPVRDNSSPHSCSSPSSSPPPPGQTELPTCPVCLERLDEHVSGIVTTVCNHMFHSECLQKWADTTCPVCRYCVQGAANTSRCGVCGTAVDLWICLICGHVGCGRYRAGHAADHWRTSGHCYALELETQRVWDYVGDNYVHRLIQSKTDGKLVELAAPASPHAAGRGGAGGGPRHHHHHSNDSMCGGFGGGGGGGFGVPTRRDGVSGGGGGGVWGRGGGEASGGLYGTDVGAGSSGGPDAGGGPGWSSADEELKEALMASKLDAIAVEYNHLLASQLDSQRQYYEGLVAQATLDADHRCAQAGAAADKAQAEADEAAGAAREEARRRQVAERKASETAEALRTIRQDAEFLRSLNETLLANQRDLKQQLAAEKARADAAERTAGELREQVRDLAFFIEAQRTINDASGGELREGTVLPLPQGSTSRGGRSNRTASGSSRAGARAPGGGGGSGRPAAK